MDLTLAARIHPALLRKVLFHACIPVPVPVRAVLFHP